MTIVNKYLAILNYAFVPVVCDKCGYTAELSRPTERASIDALIDIDTEFFDELM